MSLNCIFQRQHDPAHWGSGCSSITETAAGAAPLLVAGARVLALVAHYLQLSRRACGPLGRTNDGRETLLSRPVLGAFHGVLPGIPRHTRSPWVDHLHPVAHGAALLAAFLLVVVAVPVL